MTKQSPKRGTPSTGLPRFARNDGTLELIRDSLGWERHNLGAELFRLINEYLAASGSNVKTGTIVDATLIDAPSSTKNNDSQHDPEMRQTKKGNKGEHPLLVLKRILGFTKARCRGGSSVARIRGLPILQIDSNGVKSVTTYQNGSLNQNLDQFGHPPRPCGISVQVP